MWAEQIAKLSTGQGRWGRCDGTFAAHRCRGYPGSCFRVHRAGRHHACRFHREVLVYLDASRLDGPAYRVPALLGNVLPKSDPRRNGGWSCRHLCHCDSCCRWDDETLDGLRGREPCCRSRAVRPLAELHILRCLRGPRRLPLGNNSILACTSARPGDDRGGGRLRSPVEARVSGSSWWIVL